MTDLIDEGEGPALVFLHGAGVNNRMWAPQCARFRTTHRVIIPNLPGHGCIVAVGSVEQMADDVRRRLHALGVQRYVLVGLSLGGMVALEMAARDMQTPRMAPNVRRVFAMINALAAIVVIALSEVMLANDVPLNERVIVFALLPVLLHVGRFVTLWWVIPLRDEDT